MNNVIFFLFLFFYFGLWTKTVREQNWSLTKKERKKKNNKQNTTKTTNKNSPNLFFFAKTRFNTRQ